MLAYVQRKKKSLDTELVTADPPLHYRLDARPAPAGLSYSMGKATEARMPTPVPPTVFT